MIKWMSKFFGGFFLGSVADGIVKGLDNDKVINDEDKINNKFDSNKDGWNVTDENIFGKINKFNDRMDDRIDRFNNKIDNSLRKIDNKMDNLLKDIYRKNYGKNIFLLVMGMLLMALSFNLFFVPNEVVSTGSGGLAYLVSYLLELDISLVTLVVNLLLLLVGLCFFGYGYASKVLAVTILYPFFLKATSLLTRFISFNETSLFLLMVMGGALLGFATGLIRKSGFNPGGFAIIFDILKEKLYIGIGTSTLIINMILIVASAFIFGISSSIYAVIALLVSSYIVDKVIIGISDNKVFYIITNKHLEVRDYIIEKLNYKVTIIDSRGGYTNKKRKMLMCVVPTIEYLKLKELVKEIDPDSFFLIVDIYESSVKKIMRNV